MDAAEEPHQRKSLKATVKNMIRETKLHIVHVGYKVNSVRDVDARHSTFRCDFKLFYYWRDDFFVDRKKGESLDPHEEQARGAFWPDLVISNETELEVTHEQFVVKNPKTGEVKFSQYYRGTLSMVNMSLTHFPFDVQNLRICVRPHKMTIDEVELEPADDHAIEHHSRHEWDVVGHCTQAFATNPVYSTQGKVYSALHVVILVKREASWYVWNILVPNALLVLVNMSVFAMSTDDIGSRMETSVALLLANISIKFTIIDQLPKVPYQTVCDRFIFTCFFTQALISIMNPIIFSLCDNERYDPDSVESEEFEVFGLAMKRSKDMLANIVCGLLCVLILVSLVLWLLWKLHSYNRDVSRWMQNSLPVDQVADADQDGSLLANNGNLTAAGRVGRLMKKFGSPSKEIPDRDLAPPSDGRVAPMPASPSAGVTPPSVGGRFFKKKGNALNVHEQGFDAHAVESLADYRKRRDDASPTKAKAIDDESTENDHLDADSGIDEHDHDHDLPPPSAAHAAKIHRGALPMMQYGPPVMQGSQISSGSGKTSPGRSTRQAPKPASPRGAPLGVPHTPALPPSLPSS